MQQQQQQQQQDRLIDIAILTAKILRRILVYGAKSYEANSPQIRYITWCVAQVPVFVEIGMKAPKIGRFTILLMKTLTDFEENHYHSILPVVRGTLLLCLQYVMQNQGGGVEVILKSLTFEAKIETQSNKFN